MKNTVNEDFKKLISRIKFLYSIKQSDIASAINVKSTYLSDMINGRVPVTDSVTERLYELYSDIDDRYQNENQLIVAEPGIEYGASKNIGVNVPYFDVDFAGGWSSDQMFSNRLPDFFINNPEFDRCDFACNLVGKSVSKIIPDKSIVGFKIIEDWQTYFPQNELYGIITKNDFRTVKLVSKTKDGKFIILKPQPAEEYADRYKDQEEPVPVGFVTRFFQVVAWACFERIAM